MIHKHVFLFFLVFITGCAKTSTIQPVSTSKSEFENKLWNGETIQISTPTSGEESFRIFHQGATGFVPVSALRRSAETRATAFCSRKNKSLNVIQETASTTPLGLGEWPSIELIFECVALN
jgi:hypothetical protein